MNLMEQGAALVAAGRFHEALLQFSTAVRLDPGSVNARVAMAQACVGAGDLPTAIAWLSDACRVDPDSLVANSELAGMLLNQKLYGQALPVYARLYALGARDDATLLHYGFCQEQTGGIAAAAKLWREAVAANPGFMEAHVNLAGVLWRLSEHEASLVHARKAAELAPSHPYAVRILGTALLHLNRLAEAEIHLRHALQLLPGFPLAELDLSLTLLMAGRLQEGWAMYEKRWRDADRLQRPPFFQPQMEWKGPREQPLAGKRILVYGEQGRGDVINFIRYARLLQNDGATVHAAVQPELAPLVESMEGVQCLRPGGSVQVDYMVALLELPLHYATTLENVPAQVPYLHAPEAKVAQWRQRLKPWDGVLKVGIAWAGQVSQVNNLNRSAPLGELLPLLELPGVQCFSLQKFSVDAFTDVKPPDGCLVDFTAEWADFTDSAAMMENLDLVISVCTAIPHLAGALGKPAWVMLPPNADWRWLLERDDSPWYPSVRLFRRGFDEPRSAQVQRVLKALKHEKAALMAGRQGSLV